MWLSHPTCKSVVQKAWHSHITGSRAFQLRHKLSSIEKEFLIWNKEVFGRLDHEIYQIQLQLQIIQNSISSIDDVHKESVVRGELEILLQREEIMWAQKARSDWILLGDRNTFFYQTVVKQMRARNRILQLQMTDGSITED